MSGEIDASKIIIGSSKSRKDYHYNSPVTGPNSRIEPYKNYIMRQTDDDRGINGTVNLIFGFKTLKQDCVIAQKSLTTILNIVNKLFGDKIDTFALIWKTDRVDYDGAYFNVSDIDDCPAARLEYTWYLKTMRTAKLGVHMEMLNAIMNRDYSETYRIDLTDWLYKLRHNEKEK